MLLSERASMFLVRKPQYHLFRHDNVWIKFNSYFDLLQYILKQRRNTDFYIGKTFEDKKVRKAILEDIVFYAKAIVYDYELCLIDPVDIDRDLIKYREELDERLRKSLYHRLTWYNALYNRSHNKIFRYDPIYPSPRRYKHYNCYRHVRTTQERRMSLSCEKEYIRARRNHKNLITNWDDKPRSRRTKGWKNSKKLKQWE